MLLNPSDTVDIKIFYKKDGHSYLVLTEEELAAKFKELEKSKKSKTITKEAKEEITKQQKALSHDNFGNLNVKMRVLTWGDYNQFQDNATRTLPTGERHFDYKRYKEDRLKNLIVSWDLKGPDDKDVEFNPSVLSFLPYQVGESIIRGFDEVTYYDEEKEKN